ncbi:mucin-2 [Patella vulgata]|uniref:mucin-2 n=1 Tax=Patella vulgata TaxID=6465 RepID=UPI0024A91D00|nr:mucin-2 [Patella vulgata]
MSPNETVNPTQQRVPAVPKPITKTNSVPPVGNSIRSLWAARLASRKPQKTPVTSIPSLKDGLQKQAPLVFTTRMPQYATSAPQIQQESKPLSASWDIKATLSQMAQRVSKEQQQLRLSNSISSSSVPTSTKQQPVLQQQVTEPSQTTPQQVSTVPSLIQSAIDMVQKVQGAGGAQSSNAISTGQVQSSTSSKVDTGTLKQLSSVISDLTRYLESTLGMLNNTANETPKESLQTTPGSSLPNINTPTSMPSSPSSQPIITETLNQPIVTNSIPSNGVNADIPAPFTEMPNMFNPLTETPGASNTQPAPISMSDVLRSRFMNRGLPTQSQTAPINNSPSNIIIERIAESVPTAPPTEVINANQLPSDPNALANMNLLPAATSGSEPTPTNQNALGDALSIFSTSGNSPFTISESRHSSISTATESPFTAVAQDNQAPPEPLVTNAAPSTAVNAVTAFAETPLNQATAEATSQTVLPVEQAGTQTGNTGSLTDRFASAGASTNQEAINPATTVDQASLVETPLNPTGTRLTPSEMPIEQVGTQAGTQMNQVAVNPATTVDQASLVETPLNPTATSLTPSEMPIEQVGTQAGTQMNQAAANPATTVDQTSLAETPLNPAPTAGTVTAVDPTTLAETPLNPAATNPTPTEMPMKPSGTVTAVDPTTLAETPLNPAPTEVPMEPTGTVTAVDPTTLAETPLNPAATNPTPTEMPMKPAGTVTAVDPTTLAETPLNSAATNPTPTEMPMEPAGTVTAVDQTTLVETPLNPAPTSPTLSEMPIEPIGTQADPSAQQVAVDPTTPGQVMNPEQSLNTITESVGNPSWQTNNAVNINQINPDPNPNTSLGPLQNEQMVVGNNPFETSNKIVLSPAAATIPGSPIAQTAGAGFADQAPETPISETANSSQQGTMPNFNLAQWNALRSFMAAFPQVSQAGLLRGLGALPQTSITQPQPVVAPPPSTMPPQSTSVVEPQPEAAQSQTVYQPQGTVQPPTEGQAQQVVTVQVA